MIKIREYRETLAWHLSRVGLATWAFLGVFAFVFLLMMLLQGSGTREQL